MLQQPACPATCVRCLTAPACRHAPCRSQLAAERSCCLVHMPTLPDKLQEHPCRHTGRMIHEYRHTFVLSKLHCSSTRIGAYLPPMWPCCVIHLCGAPVHCQASSQKPWAMMHTADTLITPNQGCFLLAPQAAHHSSQQVAHAHAHMPRTTLMLPRPGQIAVTILQPNALQSLTSTAWTSHTHLPGCSML
jgi:hypothetical protein